MVFSSLPSIQSRERNLAHGCNDHRSCSVEWDPAGGLYGAVALGLSLIFGVMRVINFAHGSFLMVAMYIPFGLWHFGDQSLLGHLFYGPAIFIFGYLIQATVLSALFARERPCGRAAQCSHVTAGSGSFWIIWRLFCLALITGP